MISVVGMAAGERDAARAEDAAAEEIWANVFSALIVTPSCCLMELDGIGDAEDVVADSEAKSFSLGRELIRLGVELVKLLTMGPRPVLLLPLPMVLLVVLLDLDDFELLSRCDDEDDDEDDEGSLS